MGKRMPSCAGWLHEYVASDPSVVRSNPPADPTPFLRSTTRDASIDTLLWAVPRALRSSCVLPEEFGLAERRLFLLSAARWTRYSGAELARRVGCHPTSAQLAIRRERAGQAFGRDGTEPDAGHMRDALTADELRAMALILADPRLGSAAAFEATAVRTRLAGGAA